MNKIYILFLMFILTACFLNAQNEPSLLFQNEIKYKDQKTDAEQVVAGFEDNVVYVGSEAVVFDPTKQTAVLQKLSGESLSLEWEIIDSSEYDHTLPIIKPGILKRTSDNSLLWVVDKNSLDVENYERYNLLNINTADGTNQNIADLNDNSRNEVWGDKVISTNSVNAGTDSATTIFRVYDSSGDSVDVFDFDYPYYINSSLIIYEDYIYYLKASFNDNNTTDIIVTKYNLNSNSAEWEKSFQDNSYDIFGNNVASVDSDGNFIFAYTSADSSTNVYKYSPTGDQVWNHKKRIQKDNDFWGIVISNSTNQVVLVGRFHNQDDELDGYNYGINLNSGEELYNQVFEFNSESGYNNFINAACLLNGNKLVLVGKAATVETGDNYMSSSHIAVFSLTNAPTSTDEINALPNSFVLNQNYPNPFNPSTVISYSLPAESRVKLSVYNILGQEIAQLKNTIQTAGEHKAQWNADGISSGVYFYRLSAESIDGSSNFTNLKKMVLLR